MSMAENDYNRRLFSGGIRGFMHNARFDWARDIVRTFNLPRISMIELGCFDGRLIDYMPPRIDRYVGLDAGWEGGLAIGQKRFAGDARFTLQLASDPSALKAYADKSFNLAAAIETLEHVPPDMVEGYLEELARVLDGYFIIEAPNEKGPLFLIKYIAKKLMTGTVQPYTFKELIAATLGRLQDVERNDHKGFDYDALAAQVGRHFDLVSVKPIQFPYLPTFASFSIGIVARSKKPSGIG